MRIDNTATPQRLLFAEPQSTIDQLRELWARTSESERMTFLEEVRRAFLFRKNPDNHREQYPR